MSYRPTPSYQIQRPPTGSPALSVSSFQLDQEGSLRDLDAFQARMLDAGGTIVYPIDSVEFGTNQMRVAFFADPEGHLLEVLER